MEQKLSNHNIFPTNNSSQKNISNQGTSILKWFIRCKKELFSIGCVGFDVFCILICFILI